ncbi:Phage major tail protein [Streptococcus sp. A12]|uniref:major tail protein n=1 Tax=Streptococcus sp. A12 TaxID=1759399 RepID=UPI000F670E31|nr:major tail protein [Streptococcus sp. A12]RSK01630.1 Phage major tail protein [Streptococcus sp. A12]
MTQQKQGTATVGFKSLTVRILDGKETPTEGDNLFIIQGKAGEGATQTAKISGLAADAIKSFGSNIAYYVNNRGVGDVKVDLGLLDIPVALYVKALGYEDDDGILDFGADTVSKDVAILLESNTADGGGAYYGFYKGNLAMDAIDLNTLKEKAEELATTNVSFAAGASTNENTKNKYGTMYFGSDETKIKKMKAKLGMAVAG